MTRAHASSARTAQPEPEPGQGASRSPLGLVATTGPAIGEDAVLEATRAMDQVVQRIFNAGLVLHRGSTEAGGMTPEQRDGALAELDAAGRELSVAHIALGGPPGPGSA
jgi:hypothetical protein